MSQPLDFPFSVTDYKVHILEPIAELSPAEQFVLFENLSNPTVLKYLNRVAAEQARNLALSPIDVLENPNFKTAVAFSKGIISVAHTILEAVKEHTEKQNKGTSK